MMSRTSPELPTLAASRPNFDQKRFLRQISRWSLGSGDHPAANQEDQTPVAGSRSQAEQIISPAELQAGRITPAAGTSALARVMYNSGAVASSSFHTGREAPTLTPIHF